MHGKQGEEGIVGVRQTSLVDLLGAPGARFAIPPYQRAYAWGSEQCRELWLDIKRAARKGTRHFTGTLLITQGCPAQVVDGQQRLTTLTLLICALCVHLREAGNAVDGQDARALAERFLLEGGALKLMLRSADAQALQAVIAQATGASAPAPGSASAAPTVADAFAFFRRSFAEDGTQLSAIWRGIQLLFAIEARMEDSIQAQTVFESLNSKGRALNIADLSRNYLLLSESRAEQMRLYSEYWRQMEELFAPDPGSLRLNSAVKGWLSVRFRGVRLRSTESVYSGFKQYVEDEYTGTKEDLLREMRGFCLVWAENYRYHAVKKFKSAFDWAVNGAPTLTAGYPLKKANDEAYANRVREELKRVNADW